MPNLFLFHRPIVFFGCLFPRWKHIYTFAGFYGNLGTPKRTQRKAKRKRLGSLRGPGGPKVLDSLGFWSNNHPLWRFQRDSHSSKVWLNNRIETILSILWFITYNSPPARWGLLDFMSDARLLLLHPSSFFLLLLPPSSSFFLAGSSLSSLSLLLTANITTIAIVTIIIVTTMLLCLVPQWLQQVLRLDSMCVSTRAVVQFGSLWRAGTG